MATKEIKASKVLKFTYDENSQEFKETFEWYKKGIEPSGSIDDMLVYISYNILHLGLDTLVGCVGYVGEGDDIPEEVPYSGIQVKPGWDDFVFEPQIAMSNR